MNLNNAIKQFKKSPNNSFSIYLFHGVIKKLNKKNSVANYNNKHINIKKFTTFIKEISKIGNAISMNDIYEITKRKKKLKKKSFAITFDDGFENNYSIAAPILINYKIPFTFYIATYFVDQNAMSWIDKVDYAIDKTKKKYINVPELKMTFQIQNRKSKIYFLNKIRKYLKENKKVDPYKFSYSFCKKLKITKFPTNNVIYKKMNWEKLKRISKNNLCLIGGHSHTHRILNYLNKKDLNNEIKLSLRLIEKNLGYRPIHYSYPEGFKKSFSKQVINKLKINNIKCCPTAIEGINSGYANPFFLKRIPITS